MHFFGKPRSFFGEIFQIAEQGIKNLHGVFIPVGVRVSDYKGFFSIKFGKMKLIIIYL